MAPSRCRVTAFGAAPRRAVPARLQVELSAVEAAFARRLAHTDKTVRNKGFDFVEQWLRSKDDLTNIECLRMWKAIFHGYWLVDKYGPQLKFSVRVAMLTRLVDTHPDGHNKYIKFCSAFYIIMSQEWKNICHHRVDKYFLLFKVFLTELLDRARNLHWSKEAVDDLLSILRVHGPLQPLTVMESQNSAGDGTDTQPAQRVAKKNAENTTGTDMTSVEREGVSISSIGITYHFLLNFVKQLEDVSADPTPVKTVATVKCKNKFKRTTGTTPTGGTGTTGTDNISGVVEDDCGDLFKAFTNPHLDEDEVHEIRLKAITGNAFRPRTQNAKLGHDADTAAPVATPSCPCPKHVLDRLLEPLIEYSIKGSKVPLLRSIHTNVFRKMPDALWHLPKWAVKLFKTAAGSGMPMRNRNLYYETIDELDKRLADLELKADYAAVAKTLAVPTNDNCSVAGGTGDTCSIAGGIDKEQNSGSRAQKRKKSVSIGGKQNRKRNKKR